MTKTQLVIRWWGENEFLLKTVDLLKVIDSLLECSELFKPNYGFSAVKKPADSALDNVAMKRALGK